MKKLFSLFFAFLLCSTFAFAISAKDDAPLIFVDATRRTPPSDLLEGFTVQNVSDEPIDLAQYDAWYGRATTQEKLDALDASAVTKRMPLADVSNTYILQPGQKAYIWCVYSTVYKTKAPTADGEVYLVEEGKDGAPNYRFDNFRKAVEYLVQQGNYRVSPIAEDTLIVPMDSTYGNAFGPDGEYASKPNCFNLQNSYFIRLYLTENIAPSASEAFCTADLDGTGNGTYLNANNEVKCSYGTFVYKEDPYEVAMQVSFEAGTYLFGSEPEAEVILPVEPTPEDAFRVMTVNVLNDDYKTSRFSYIEKTIETLNPDIIGFQECREGFNTMIDNIEKQGYASVVDTLVDDPDDTTIVNCVKILYKGDKYTLVENSAGARRFQEKYQDSWTKSLCYCVLEDKITKERVIVVNAHFEVYIADRGVPGDVVLAQRESNAREVLEAIETLQTKYGDLPAVLLGDLNATEVQSSQRILLSGGLRDAVHLTEDSYPWLPTFHGGDLSAQKGEYPIDHVYVTSEDFSVIRAIPYTDTIGEKASDHYPFYADLKLAPNADTSCADTHTSETPLMIVDATRRVPVMGDSSDMIEGFTVLNVSDKPVDLSHINVWYTTAKTEEELKGRDASAITFVMRMADRTGKYVLQPGQKAYIWMVYSTVYKSQVETADGLVSLVEKGEDGYAVYRTDLFRKAIEHFASKTDDAYTVSRIEDDTLIVPFDRSTRDTFGADGTYSHMEKSFNLVNSAYIRLYLTYDSAMNASEAFCIADLDGTGNGTYINAENAIKVNYGTYKYLPSGSPLMQTASFAKDTYYFGANTEGFSVAAPVKTEVKLMIGNMTGYVNGVAKSLDAAPVIRNSRTMLPVRFVAENLGASVGWDGATSTVTVSTATTKIEIVIGKATAKINGAEVTLDSPAFIENSRTYLPVRFVSENLGASVGWDGATSTVTLTK